MMNRSSTRIDKDSSTRSILCSKISSESLVSGVGEGVGDISSVCRIVPLILVIVGDSSVVPCGDVVTVLIMSIVSSVDKDLVMKGLERIAESDDVTILRLLILLSENVTNNVGLPNVKLLICEKPVIKFCIGTIRFCVVENISVLS